MTGDQRPTTIAQAIKAAIPDASEEVVDYVLWERTPYPMGRVTARSLYKAASQWRRACKGGQTLCTFCDRRAANPESFVPTCQRCDDALLAVSNHQSADAARDGG